MEPEHSADHPPPAGSAAYDRSPSLRSLALSGAIRFGFGPFVHYGPGTRSVSAPPGTASTWRPG